MLYFAGHFPLFRSHHSAGLSLLCSYVYPHIAFSELGEPPTVAKAPVRVDGSQPPPPKRAKIDTDSGLQLYVGEIADLVAELEGVASTHGLTQIQLISASELVPLFLDSPHSQVSAFVRRLSKSILIPRENVPFDALVNVLGPLSQTQLLEDPKTSVALLKWAAVVCPLVCPQLALRTVHQLFFRLLTMTSNNKMRFYAAQVLFKITRKSDVTPSRVAALLRLRDGTFGTDPESAALLLGAATGLAPLHDLIALFQDFRPDFFVADASRSGPHALLSPLKSKSTAASAVAWNHPIKSPRVKSNISPAALLCPDPHLWSLALKLRTTAASFPESIPGGLPAQSAFDLGWNISSSASAAADRVETGIATAATTAINSSPNHDAELKFVPASLSRFESFVRNIDGAGSSSAESAFRSVAAAGSNRWLQHWLRLDRHVSAIQRISTWSQTLLDSVFVGPASDAKLALDQRSALQSLRSLSEAMNEAPPAVVSFLRQFLKTWDGFCFGEEVLGLLRWIPPLPWEDLYGNILLPLGKLFSSASADLKTSMIICFTRMLRGWLRFSWGTYHKHMATRSRRPLDLGFTFTSIEGREVDYHRTMYEFVRYVDQLGSLALLAETSSPNSSFADPVGVQQAILDFFDLVSRLHSRYGLPFVVTPSPAIVYRCLLSSNAAALSRICGILARYKAEFDKLKSVMVPNTDGTSSDPASMPLAFPNGAEKIVVLNCYIWMFCGALWRSRLFIPPPEFLRDDLRLPASILDQIRFDGLSNCLGLTHAPSMLSLAKEYLDELQEASSDPRERHARVSPDLIKDVVKEHYVGYLHQRRLTGLHNFLFSFIAALVRLQTTLTSSNGESSSL